MTDFGGMYDQGEEDDSPRPQPIQLRLAGKATIIDYADKKLAVPRIEYVEHLEQELRTTKKTIGEQLARISKLESTLNIVTRRISNLETENNKKGGWSN